MPLTPETVSVELRPLMLWMANTTELLSFVQEKVLEMEKEAEARCRVVRRSLGSKQNGSPRKILGLPW